MPIPGLPPTPFHRVGSHIFDAGHASVGTAHYREPVNAQQADHPVAADLFAAAPELYEACESASQALYNVPCVGDAYDQQHSDTHMRASLVLKAALAKARGETNADPAPLAD